MCLVGAHLNLLSRGILHQLYSYLIPVRCVLTSSLISVRGFGDFHLDISTNYFPIRLYLVG